MQPAGSKRLFSHVVVALVSLALLPAAAAAAPGDLLRVSADPYLDPLGQHRTEVEPDTFAHHGTFVGAFQVGRTFNGGANNIGWVRSSNGAQSFTEGFLPGTTKLVGGAYDRISDPSVAYDAAHRTWLISSLGLLDQPYVHGEAILVSRSRDAETWGPPVEVATAGPAQDFDKNWTVCDNHPSSPFYGHCYTEFDNFLEADRIYMSTSTDGGRTWGTAVPAAAGSLGLGGQPVVQPDGTVIVPIVDFIGRWVMAFRSTDGGETWSEAVVIALTPQHKPAGNLRAGGLPTAEIDRNGKVYVVWDDCSFSPGCTANGLVMSTSSNGVDWSPPVRVPTDPPGSDAERFIAGLGVDPRTAGRQARLGLTYYGYEHSDCTVETCELTASFISSRSGGETWSNPTRLAGPMRLDWLADTSQGRMVGDYVSTSLVGWRAVPLFADAGPPSGGLFDEAMATIQGGLPIGAANAPAHTGAVTTGKASAPLRLGQAR